MRVVKIGDQEGRNSTVMLNPIVPAIEVAKSKPSIRRVSLLSRYCQVMIVVLQDCAGNTVH